MSSCPCEFCNDIGDFGGFLCCEPCWKKLHKAMKALPDASLAADLEEAAKMIVEFSQMTRRLAYYEQAIDLAARLRTHAQKLKDTK
jgi:hypothetical protein